MDKKKWTEFIEKEDRIKFFNYGGMFFLMTAIVQFVIFNLFYDLYDLRPLSYKGEAFFETVTCVNSMLATTYYMFVMRSYYKSKGKNLGVVTFLIGNLMPLIILSLTFLIII